MLASRGHAFRGYRLGLDAWGKQFRRYTAPKDEDGTCPPAGYMSTGKPGLGIDVDETPAARHPLRAANDGGVYRLDRAIDSGVVNP